MSPTPQALASAARIAELADQLGTCADALHARIVVEVQARAGRAPDQAALDAARALFDDEQLLRQRANGLYADAATLVVQSLAVPQKKVVALTADAAQHIRTIAVLGDAVGLVAGVLMLAGAAATGQPAPIVLALEKIAREVKALQALAPKKPA